MPLSWTPLSRKLVRGTSHPLAQFPLPCKRENAPAADGHMEPIDVHWACGGKRRSSAPPQFVRGGQGMSFSLFPPF